jgi:hypothetical protein
MLCLLRKRREWRNGAVLAALSIRGAFNAFMHARKMAIYQGYAGK